MQEFDLVVIGSGPGGQRAAVQAAKLGKRAAVIEKREIVGGVTAHTGTIPSKTLREAVLFLSGWRQRGFYGQSYRVKSDIKMADLMHRLQATVSRQIEIIRHQLLRNGVTVINGEASFVDRQRLRILALDGKETIVRGEHIVVATGTVPHRPDDIPFDDERIIDSDGILGLSEIPRSMTVIGAGVIGVEYATIFSALDTRITLVDGREQMLDFIDRDVIDEFRHQLQSRDILLRLGEQLASVERDTDGSVITRLASGKRLRSDTLMVAAGRVGATAGLALDQAGLEADERGRLRVNEHYQTSVPNIYAVGDVIGFPALASTSAEQGRLAACHAFGADCTSSPEYFPFGIYAVPEISMVGKTEQELQAAGIPYDSGIAHLRETARGQIQGNQEGLLKLVFGLEDRRLLGVHIIGEGATELIHIGQAVMAHGGQLDYLVEAVFNYPTLAEAYKIAALAAWNRIR
ncbi:MAG: Si-specific NAD(P)(+) transhydrogenase [Gammaproteobacteria bacterium]|nr:MAG: Si-specific NAD(P)(+) transhydrogenase [Gammaproteobacteria bacterium]